MRLVILATVVTTAGLLANPTRADEKDAIRIELEKAKSAYQEAASKAKNALLTAFDEAIKAVAQTGDLDAVKGLQADRKAFEQSAKMPTSAKLGTAASEYQRAIRQAKSEIDRAYEHAVRDYTKGLKIEQAEAVRKEWKESSELATSSKPNEKKPVKVDPTPARNKWIAGEWKLMYGSKSAPIWRTYIIEPDGEVKFIESNYKAKLRPIEGSSSFTLDFGDGKIERVCFVDNRLFVEHFNPKSDFEKNQPDVTAVGKLIKQK
jgi:hypothetical protein